MTPPPVPWVPIALLFLAGCEGGTATTSSDGGGGAVPDAAERSGRDGGGPGDGGRPGDAGASDDGDAPGDAGRRDAGGDVAFVPYFFEDFEDHAEGTRLGDLRPWDAAGRSVVTREQGYHSLQSARMEIRAGDGGGFGKWGAIVPIAPRVTKGGEIWVRLRVYWPSSFEFSASPWMKFLRLHDRRGDGSNGGYNDLYVHRADSTTSVLRTIKEIHDVWAVYDGPSIPRERWETYEMYLHVDDVPVDRGGDGRVRIWRDGELIFDRTDVPTVTGPDDSIDYFYLFTYWNNESPPNNHCYVDDLVIATDASPPPNRDAAGHAFIGDW